MIINSVLNEYTLYVIAFYLFLRIEFLLGSRYLVAPVIVEGAISRDIYFPKGRWIDANNGAFVEGPKWIRGYAAPLDMLPYFVRHP